MPVPPSRSSSRPGVPLRLNAWWSVTLPEPVDDVAGLFVARELVQDLWWVDKPILLTLADGKVVELVPKERLQGRKETMDVTYWTIPVDVSKEAIEAMAASPVTKAQIWVGSNAYERDVKPKKAKKLQAGAKCLAPD